MCSTTGLLLIRGLWPGVGVTASLLPLVKEDSVDVGTLSKLLAVCECEREVELLVGKAECLKYKLSHDNHVTPSDEESAHCGAIVKDLFQVFKVKLTQTNWKSNPSYKHSLVWCVNNLPHPHMEPHLQNVLPPLLMFVDDYEVSTFCW